MDGGLKADKATDVKYSIIWVHFGLSLAITIVQDMKESTTSATKWSMQCTERIAVEGYGYNSQDRSCGNPDITVKSIGR